MGKCEVGAIILHVAGVAKSTVSGLGGTLVEAHLQVQLTLVGAQLLLGEAALVLVGHLGAQGGAGEFRVLLRLHKVYTCLGTYSVILLRQNQHLQCELGRRGRG